AGSTGTPATLWRRLFPGRAVQLRSGQAGRSMVLGDKPQIIGGLIDSSGSDNMLAEVKKQTLIRCAEVTLVHVVEEESDSHERRYGITVEGEKLMARLEQAVQLLRRCSIDPTIRLVRGEVVEVLGEICANLDAELLVLGRSRKKEGLLRSGSLRNRLEKKSPCPLMVGEKQQFSPAIDLAALRPDQLTADQVLACDIFLVDLWYEHLHYHTDCIYQLLLYPEQDIDLSEANCRFGHFLASLETSGNWQEVISMLEPVHQQFHQVVARMAEFCDNDHAGLQDLYIRESLPLSCRLKKELARVSMFLRAHLGTEPPPVPFLADETCPVTMPDLACYGPLLRAFDLDQDLCVLVEGKNVSSTEQAEGD
ncbi:MAG: universal stress protein, partial [Thermodesulfobacteriota bacterium]|nr:universal stress protein [Thermodesulfobacteriota bacterium]